MVLLRSLLPDTLSMASSSLRQGSGQHASIPNMDSDPDSNKGPTYEGGYLYPMASLLGMMGSSTPMGMSCSGALALSIACAQDPGDPYARDGADECLSQIILAGFSPHPVVQHIAAATLSVMVSTSEAGLVAQKAAELRNVVIDLAAAEAAEGLRSLVTAELKPRLPPREPLPPLPQQQQSVVNGVEGRESAAESYPASLVYYVSPIMNQQSMACRSASLLPALWQV